MAKKILIATGIFPPDIGGPATYSELILKELPKRDLEIILLSYGERQKYESANVYKVSKNIPKGLRHFIYFLKLCWLGRRADIIFAQDPVSVGFPSVFAAMILGKKLVLKIVGDYAWEQSVQRFGVKEVLDEFLKKKHGFRVSFFQWLESYAAKKADKIIVPSEYLKKVILNWGLKKEKIEVIYNSFELSANDINFSPSKNGLVLLSVGRLVPWKGFDGLLEVFRRLSQKKQNLKLLIAGDGPDKEMLKQQAKDLLLGESVEFLGSVNRDKIQKILKSSDIFVLNSSYEGFSHIIIESMANALPVAVSRVGGNPEIVTNGENGFLFEYDNLNEMENILEKLINNPDLRLKIGKAAEARTKDFSLELMLGRLSKLLNYL